MLNDKTIKASVVEDDVVKSEKTIIIRDSKSIKDCIKEGFLGGVSTAVGIYIMGKILKSL